MRGIDLSWDLLRPTGRLERKLDLAA